MHGLLRRQTAHKTNDALFATRIPLAAQHLRATPRVKQLRVHPAPPVVHVLNAVPLQLCNRLRRRRQRQLTHVVHRARPLPRNGGNHGRVVLRGKASHIRLIQRHRGNPQLGGGKRARAAKHKRAGQVDHVRLKLRQRRGDVGSGHTNRQGIHHRDTHRGHAHNLKAQVVRDLLLEVTRARCHHDRLVALRFEMLKHTQHGVGHTVDVWQERFCNDSHSHTQSPWHN